MVVIFCSVLVITNSRPQEQETITSEPQIMLYRCFQRRSNLETHGTEAGAPNLLHQISTDSINVVFCCSNVVTVVLACELHIYAAVLTAGGCRSCGLFCEAHLHDISINRGQFQRRRDENVALLFLHQSP